MAVDHCSQLFSAFAAECFVGRQGFGGDGGCCSDWSNFRRGEEIGSLHVSPFILQDRCHVEVTVGLELQTFDEDDGVHWVVQAV